MLPVTKKKSRMPMWDGKGDYIMWRQSLIHALRKAGYGYVLSIEGIYQFDDPEDKASDIYKTSAIKREDRITNILGKHFKENPDTARQSLSNAYYEVCSTIKPDIVRALQESGKVSRNVGSLITYLDAKHIRKDNYTLAALYESYFFLTLHEGDNIETHIELLNHAATLLHNAGVPNFMDERIRSLHLIKQLPISWEPWRETYLAAAAITTSVTTSDTTSESANPLSWAATTTALIAAANHRKLDGGTSIEAVLHTSHKHSKPKTSKPSTIICTFCSNKGHAEADCNNRKWAIERYQRHRASPRTRTPSPTSRIEHEFMAEEASVAIVVPLRGSHHHPLQRPTTQPQQIQGESRHSSPSSRNQSPRSGNPSRTPSPSSRNQSPRSGSSSRTPSPPSSTSSSPRSSVSPPREVPNAAAQGRLQDVKKYLTSTLNHSRDLSPHATQKSRASPGEREFTFTSDCSSDFEFQQ